MSEAIDIQTQLQEKWMIFWWALGIGLLSFKVGWSQGLFHSFRASSLPVIRGIDVLKGFGFFLFIELFFLPSLITISLHMMNKELDQLIHVHPQIKGWLNLLIIVGGFGAVILSYFTLTMEQRKQLWQQTTQPWYYNVGIGILTWFISYPLVMAFSQLLSILTLYLFHSSLIEQVAVQHLRRTLNEPLLFGITAFAVTVLVPLTEEFLFRGLLQSWFKQKFHQTYAAIIASSLIFALFHYSSAQGITNIELLSSLFLLSCMLGFIYERQRSLWAPIGLHSFFNLMSLLMILNEP